MARYEYLCRDCGSAFELLRPMIEAEGEVRCPAGHDQVRRRFTVHAVSGGGAGVAPATSAPMGGGGGGGCCGGGCGCR